MQVSVDRFGFVIGENCSSLHDLVHKVNRLIVCFHLLPLFFNDLGQLWLPVLGCFVGIFEMLSIKLSISFLLSDWRQVHSLVGIASWEIERIELTRVYALTIEFLW